MNNIPHFLKVELHSELINILNYWMLYAPDYKNGGFVGNIDSQNQIDYQAKKGAILNSRILWKFSSAFRVTGTTDYIDKAIRAYEYIMEHFIDRKHGGVYWELHADGSLSNGRNQVYAQAFTIYGLSEYYRITKDQEALNQAVRLLELIELHSLDANQNGYIEALTHDWKKLDDLCLSEKDANESKTMNTHLHILEAYTNLFRVWKDNRLKDALKNLIELFLNKFINHHGNLNLFFDDEWNIKSSEISFGHDIECSWLLTEASEILGNAELMEKAAEKAGFWKCPYHNGRTCQEIIEGMQYLIPMVLNMNSK